MTRLTWANLTLPPINLWSLPSWKAPLTIKKKGEKMTNELKVLDKGFVRLLNISGAVPRDTWDSNTDSRLREFSADDTDPALVARTSFAKGFDQRLVEEDEKLVEYLIRMNHSTPIEMTTIWLEIKAPIMVVRQFDTVRTRTKNEISGRYATLPSDWYIPEVVRGKHSGGNKQGSEDNLDIDDQEEFKSALDTVCEESYRLYGVALRAGVCPEQARMFLHLNHYTQFVYKQDLHNMMHFLSLRLDGHAQWETRQYAEAIYQLLKEHLPKSMGWFDEYRRKLDTEEKRLLTRMIDDFETYYPEYNEVLKKLAKRNGIKI